MVVGSAAEKMGRAAVGEDRQDGAGFEKGSPPARKNCSGSLEKQAASPTAAAAAAAESRPRPKDPAAGAPAARCLVHRPGVKVAGRCRSLPEVVGHRCEQVSERAGSDKGAPGGSGGERRWSKCGLGGEKRAGAAG